MFASNEYPLQIIQDTTKKLLDKVYNLAPSNAATIPKLKFYFTLPYYDQHCELEAHDLIKTISRIYPQIAFIGILKKH